MVNRPGISIRRLMPHRRNGSDGSENLDESSPDELDLFLKTNVPERPQHAQTWQASRPKAPPAPITIRKGSAMSRSMSPLPPLPSEGPGSNASSLSSVDGQSDAFWSANKKAAAVLGLPESAIAGGPPSTPRRPARPGNGYLGLKDSMMSPPLPRNVKAMTLVEAKRPLSPGGTRPLSPRTIIDSSRSISPRPTPSEVARSSSPRPSPRSTPAPQPAVAAAAPQPAPQPQAQPAAAPSLTSAPRETKEEMPAELESSDKTKSKPTNQKPKEEWSDNVKQLIQETDLAFKAVGSALADAKLASYHTDRAQTPTPPPSAPSNRPPTPPKDLPPLPEASPNPDMVEVVERTPTPPLNLAVINPTRPISTAPPPSPAKPQTPSPSGKAKKPKARRNKGWPSMSAGMAARLGLSDNVTDILTGQRFKRIEADEMLTPDQIEELKKIREEARKQANLLLKSRESLESERAASRDFVYELPAESDDKDMSKLHDSTGSDEFDEDEDDEELDEWDGRDVGCDRGNMLNPPKWTRNASSGASTRTVSIAASPRDTTFLVSGRKGSVAASSISPSTRSGSIAMSTRNASISMATKLASISETSCLIDEDVEVESADVPEIEEPETMEMTLARKQLECIRTEEDERFIYLKSTPCTLTSPTFRHGPIAFSKADMNKLLMNVDDTLDWTAFQMAILGGAGDMMGGFHDDGEEHDNDVVDDIADWFDTLGFESAGALIDSSASVRSGRDSAGSMTSSNSSVDHLTSSESDDMDLPIPLLSEHPADIWNTAEAPYDTNKFFRTSGIKRWSGVPKRYGSQGSIEIPSDPIVVCGPECVDESAQMGFNMGDDLGDFLRWEAEQMCFYGAPRA